MAATAATTHLPAVLNTVPPRVATIPRNSQLSSKTGEAVADLVYVPVCSPVWPAAVVWTACSKQFIARTVFTVEGTLQVGKRCLVL